MFANKTLYKHFKSRAFVQTGRRLFISGHNVYVVGPSRTNFESLGFGLGLAVEVLVLVLRLSRLVGLCKVGRLAGWQLKSESMTNRWTCVQGW